MFVQKSSARNTVCKTKGRKMNNLFGMFIHWGIYSVAGLHEQAFAKYDFDRKQYEGMKDVFEPVKYDPEQWVLLAKNAGMKYICFTTKHHDGFCMWDTKYTDYNIMNTPYGKDVLKMLADACQKHGMKLSLYYSNPDWHHVNAYNSKSSHQWKAVDKASADFKKYREYVINQVTELLTNYGKIYTFFWDIMPQIEDRSINELVRKLQPGILINNRGYDEGDFSTPERGEGDRLEFRHFEKMTEACNAVGFNSWGYRKNEDYHSVRNLTYSVMKIMALGGSYLLNVGPRPDGTIGDREKKIIERVGKWYLSTEGCLENAEADDFDYGLKEHACIINKKNGKTYFHFTQGLSYDAVYIERFPSIPKKVRLLNTKEELPFEMRVIPSYYDRDSGICTGEYLTISNIPVDDLENEPITIEVEW